MVTYYNKSDLVKFGKYLLSQEREDRLKQTNGEIPESLPYEERKGEVHHADLANWHDSLKKS